MYILVRPIDGDINNGEQALFNEDETVMTFDTEEEAVIFLKQYYPESDDIFIASADEYDIFE